MGGLVPRGGHVLEGGSRRPLWGGAEGIAILDCRRWRIRLLRERLRLRGTLVLAGGAVAAWWLVYVARVHRRSARGSHTKGSRQKSTYNTRRLHRTDPRLYFCLCNRSNSRTPINQSPATPRQPGMGHSSSGLHTSPVVGLSAPRHCPQHSRMQLVLWRSDVSLLRFTLERGG